MLRIEDLVRAMVVWQREGYLDGQVWRHLQPWLSPALMPAPPVPPPPPGGARNHMQKVTTLCFVYFLTSNRSKLIFRNIVGRCVLFGGPLKFLFWTSGDIFSWFQSQSGQGFFAHIGGVHDIRLVNTGVGTFIEAIPESPALRQSSFFQNEEIFIQLDELDELDRIIHA